MYFVETAFNKASRRRPIASILYNSDTNDASYIPYVADTREGFDNIVITKLLPILNQPVVLSNFKNYLEAIDELKRYQSIEINFAGVHDTLDISSDFYEGSLQQHLAKRLKKLKTIQTQEWQRLAARATIAYYELQKRGVICNGTLVHPIYSIDTFSGRSKTSEFNIQGTTSDDNIISTVNTYDTFISADWIAADMRMASIISNDNALQESFKVSDPYMYIAEKLGNISRDDCKRSLLKGVYSLDPNNSILALFPQLRQWVAASCDRLATDKSLVSILGRRFYLDNERDDKSVVNASIQGSVAHAMQNVIVKLSAVMPHYLMTEMHDSVIVCCNHDSAKNVINELKAIMLHPLNGLVESNPSFPLRISVGTSWRNWKTIKEYR